MKPLLDRIRIVWLRFRRLNYRHVLPDAVLIVLSFYGSLYLRLGLDDFHEYSMLMDRYLPLFVLLRLGTFTVLGVYDIIWRFISFSDAYRFIRAIGASTVIIIASSFMVDIGRLPRAVFIIDLFLVSFLLGSVRFVRRLIYESKSEKNLRKHGRLTLLYGAGLNGRALAHRFGVDWQLGFKIVGFVDDDPSKVGRIVAGVKVLGTRADLARLIQAYGVQEVIVSIGTPSGELLREVVQICRSKKIKARQMDESVAAEAGGLQSVRTIGLEDLLNRPRKNVRLDDVRALVRGRRVLVTGAGGSIGSELARQIFDHEPSLLLLLDHSEFNLYQIDQELRPASYGAKQTIVPLLLDIKDRDAIAKVFATHSPELIFHAAAYKHVHLVEQNPVSAILNNVRGTENLLAAAEQHAVETFVLISTDKAVNPVGVMGMTKRLCELMVAEAGERLGKRYCAVRFGNVLGSSGSLIPLLKSQIENGEPLTITHKDMTRYFMLISEAVSLVLKAASMARPGDISILRMGEPVKIMDIAKSLIALMGRNESDVPIVFTGLRPGEKMFEELYLCGNEIQTEDPDILILPKGDGVKSASSVALSVVLKEIVGLAEAGDSTSVDVLKQLIGSNYRVAGHSGTQTPSRGEPRVWQ